MVSLAGDNWNTLESELIHIYYKLCEFGLTRIDDYAKSS